MSVLQSGLPGILAASVLLSMAVSSHKPGRDPAPGFHGRNVSVQDSAGTPKSLTGSRSDHKGMFYTYGINDITDSTARIYRSLGVTSVETYVTWQTCEPEAEGVWDWSRWDQTVKTLQKNGLKWVPFLILGPAYSTPDWFRQSIDHVPCRCLEHGIASKVESRWNPFLPKRIDRFLEAFAKRYKNSGVIESVLLGIQGDYGEAIYSVTGGGWTFNIPGKYHNHPGFWCNDVYALADFRQAQQKKYGNLSALNKAWGTDYKRLNEVDFPGYGDSLRSFEARVKQENNPQVDRRWLDFISWYRGAMTRWSDWWLGETRKYFPGKPIYLCTGGDAVPKHGSNFAEQARVAAKSGAGVRITNESSNYANNYVITRWVASAGKHYGAYFGFEPAGPEDEKGIVARIYNATASGANQLHDYANNVTSSPERMQVEQKNIRYLFPTQPLVPIALWYPNVSLTLDDKMGEYLKKASVLRDYSDFDYVDETMLHTGSLEEHQVLVMIWGEVMEKGDAQRISDWVKKGGRLIIMDIPAIKDVEGTSAPEELLLGADNDQGIHTSGQGTVQQVTGWDHLAEALESTLSALNLPVCDLKRDSVYVTRIDPKKWLVLNTTGQSQSLKLRWGRRHYQWVAQAGAITEMDMGKK